MSIAAILRELIAAGMSGDALVAAIERIEAAAPPPTAYEPRYAGGTPRLHEKDWWPLRWEVLHRGGFACAYCGAKSPDGSGMTADHIVPLSRGGSNHTDNLTACCLPCNSSKSDRLLSEWRGRGA